MEKFNNNFKFEDTYQSLSSVELVDPQTIKSSGVYYPTNKQSAKVLNECLGMRSYQFSNQLYNHDIDLWKVLRDKKDALESTKEYKNTHCAMIIDDMVVSILDSDEYITKFMKIISDYTADESLHFYYNYKDDEFQFVVLKDYNDSGKVGFIIRYYLSSNWITIKNVYYNNSYLYLSNGDICNKVIENDLELILDKDVLLSSCDLVYDEYTRFVEKASSTKLSIEELFSYLKYDHGLKIRYDRIDPMDFLADTEYDSETCTLLSDVLTYIYDTDTYQFINSSYLKRSVSFSKFSFYDYYKSLSNLYMDNFVKIDSLINLIHAVMSNQTNYSQIND